MTPAPAPAAVRVVPAAAADVPLEIAAIGTVEAISSVEVKARITAPVLRVRFAEGQDVKQGDILFELDPDQSRLLPPGRLDVVAEEGAEPVSLFVLEGVGAAAARDGLVLVPVRAVDRVGDRDNAAVAALARMLHQNA